MTRRENVDPISHPTVFTAQWTDTPDEVYQEVVKFWRDYEYGNDYYYVNWSSLENGPDYPVIDAFLKERGITECLIHWWW